MIGQVLSKWFWKKVGVFTSPHLVRITERFVIDGVEIAEKKLNDYYIHILDQADQWGIPLSFFEIQVIVAVQYFLEQNVDYAVFEVGLGWLYDGTNIWSQPLATYVTSICLEHTNLLWKTRSSVLRNKLGIIKKNTPLFTPYDNQQIQYACDRVGAYHVSIKWKQVPDDNLTNLYGAHQQRNALLVLESLKHVWFEPDITKKSLKHISYSGRFDRSIEGFILDTANNTASVNVLVKTLQDNDIDLTKLVIIYGSTQKDPIYCAHLVNMFWSSSVYLVDDFHRAQPVSEYAPLVNNVSDSDSSLWDAIEKIPKDSKVLITGSLYLVGSFMKLKNN